MSLTPEQAANKAKWIAALRSGKFEQARNYLHVPGGLKDKDSAFADLGLKLYDEPPKSPEGGFCCMGVAYACLSIPLGKPNKQFMNQEVMDRFGLTHENISLLARMNDDVRLGFGVIADWIEENVNGL